MAKLNTIREIAGRPDGRNTLLAKNQTSSDIIQALLRAVRESEPTAQKIASKFKGKNAEETCKNVYNFLRKEIIYDREPVEKQTAKTLRRIFDEGYGDCKHYSTSAAAIFKALKIPVYFRVIDQNGSRYNHIYTVVKYPDRDIIVDACYPYFNHEPQYFKKVDIPV